MKEDTGALTRVNIGDVRTREIRRIRIAGRFAAGGAVVGAGATGLCVAGDQYLLATYPAALGAMWTVQAVLAFRDARAAERAPTGRHSSIAE